MVHKFTMVSLKTHGTPPTKTPGDSIAGLSGGRPTEVSCKVSGAFENWYRVASQATLHREWNENI
jgi:hypothetical protein